MEVKTTICPICFQKFSQERKPMIICEEHHSICESCFNTLNKCPFCANSLTNFKPIQNLDLLKSIDQEDTNSNLSQIPIIPLDQLEIEKEPFSSGISTDNFRATWKKKQVIIKKTRIQIDSNSQKQFENELNLIGKLKHPNILPIYGITKFENRFCIVMKYAEQGNLLDKIPNLQFQEKIDLSLQIIEGLRFLHSNSIIHGDLKLKNILISKNKPKISDFGMSQLREKTTENLGITFYSNYLAPEFLKQEKFSDTSCDIFSLSIILFEIFSSKRYFHKKNRRKAFIKMMNEKRPYFPNDFPKDLSKFIKKGWKKNPQERSTLIQFIQCLEKMKNSNQPETRKELEQTNQQPNEKEKEKEKKKKSKSKRKNKKSHHSLNLENKHNSNDSDSLNDDLSSDESINSSEIELLDENDENDNSIEELDDSEQNDSSSDQNLDKKPFFGFLRNLFRRNEPRNHSRRNEPRPSFRENEPRPRSHRDHN